MIDPREIAEMSAPRGKTKNDYQRLEEPRSRVMVERRGIAVKGNLPICALVPTGTALAWNVRQEASAIASVIEEPIGPLDTKRASEL